METQVSKGQKTKASLELILAMTIFGFVGIIVKLSGLPSGYASLTRGLIGLIFLVVMCLARKEPIIPKGLGKKWILVLISGACLSVNWLLLFESYNYTSVATSTLCYYLGPIFVIIASPFILKEKLSLKKVLCATAALIGMVFVSGIIGNGVISSTEIVGIVMSTCAAFLYATVIITNKFLAEISPLSRLIVQFTVSSIIIAPYALIKDPISTVDFSAKTIILMMILGVLSTGLTYYLYFKSMKYLHAQTVAIYSYIDAVVAVLASAIVLSEEVGIMTIIGAVLIIGGAVVSEIEFKPHKKTEDNNDVQT